MYRHTYLYLLKKAGVAGLPVDADPLVGERRAVLLAARGAGQKRHSNQEEAP